MLRLPRFTLRQPTSIAEAVAALGELGSRAMVLAGGTDLLPNLKHELFTPEVVSRSRASRRCVASGWSPTPRSSWGP